MVSVSDERRTLATQRTWVEERMRRVYELRACLHYVYGASGVSEIAHARNQLLQLKEHFTPTIRVYEYASAQ
jgi:hypothetical protein